MRKISSVAIAGGFFIAAACILAPATPSTSGITPAETPTSGGETVVDSAEAAAVTFPKFVTLLQRAGGKVSVA